MTVPYNLYSKLWQFHICHDFVESWVGPRTMYFLQFPNPASKRVSQKPCLLSWYLLVSTVRAYIWPDLRPVNTKPYLSDTCSRNIRLVRSTTGNLVRLLLAKIRTMAWTNSPDMPSTRTKKVPLGIRNTRKKWKTFESSDRKRLLSNLRFHHGNAKRIVFPTTLTEHGTSRFL